MEDSPSGLWRTLGKRVGVTASRVRISYPPPGLEPRKPLKTFGFRGFALIPPDCWFPPGTLRFDTFGPDPPRVSHIGTDDSENASGPPPAACPPSKPGRAPRAPRAGRSGSPHAPAQFFPSRTPATQRDAPHTAPPSAKVPPDPLRQTPHERIRVPQQPIRTVNRLLDT